MGTEMIYRDLQGIKIPALGFGTWELEGTECETAVGHAIDVGYRHIDTAPRYGNEADIGRALRVAGVPREQMFLTTKVWHDSLRYEQVLASLRASLDRLQTDYVDLFLVHWPNPAVALEDTMAAMVEAQHLGWTRRIGVSNFTRALLTRCRDDIKVPVVVNQVEFHPYLKQSKLRQWLNGSGTLLEAYQPLASGRVMKDPVIGDIAASHGRNPAQVTLRWMMQQDDLVAIPRSRTPKNIADNFHIFDFELTPDEMTAITLLQGNNRFLSPSFAPEWDD